MRRVTGHGPEAQRSTTIEPGGVGSARTTAGRGVAPWLTLTACLFAVFMQMLDLTIVNTALPVLAHDLSASSSAQLLVVSAYGLGFACTLLTAARMGDRFGRRRLFLAGMTVFVATSLWCGIATDSGELVAARAVQGLGAAAVAAQTIAIVAASFPPRRHPLVFGVYGAVAGLAGLAGPLLGGLIVSLNPVGLGWRAIFVLNLPLGAAALSLAARYLRLGPAARASRPDRLGAALSAAGLLLVLYPLVTAHTSGWTTATTASAAAGLAVLAGFGWQQCRLRAAGGAPLIPAELLTDRTFALGSLALLIFYGLFAALLLTVSVTAQTGLGMSAWQTGRLMLPFALGALLAAPTAAIPLARWGSRVLTLGITLFALAIADLALVLDPASGRIDTHTLAVPVFLAGAGMGWFAAPLPAIMVAGLGEPATGAASGLAPTVQQLGSALGAATLGAAFFARTAAAHTTSVLAHHLPTAPITTAQSYLGACRTVLWIIAAAAFVVMAVTIAMHRRPEAPR